MHRFLSGVALMVGCSVALPAVPQETQPVPAPPSTSAPAKRTEFFSGIVSLVEANSVTVTRKSITRDTVTRRFLKNSETKVEGNLRVKARVTVRYVPGDEGLRAIHIIVR